MTEIVKETTTVQNQGPKAAITRETKSIASSSQTIEYLIYFIFGFLEILLAFRLVLKLAGANPGSMFVSLIYSITSIFVLPFEGIFRRAITEGIETISIFEPSTVVAIIVYAVVSWGIVLLVRILSGEKQPTE